MDNYGIERDVGGALLDRDGVEGKGITFVEGRCMVDPEDPNNTNRRDLSWYVQNVINPGIESGDIGDGVRSKFDDRKPRLDKISLTPGNLEVALGMTYFAENKATISRGENDPEEAKRLHELGRKMHGDRYAFFARAPGAAGALITSDGEMILGVRLQEDSHGLLCPAGGYLTFREDIRDMNVTEEALREVGEEFGVTPDDITGNRFVGVYTNPLTGEADFVHLVNTTKPTAYFTSGEFRKDRKDEEHGRIVTVRNMDEAQSLLYSGRLLDGEEVGLMYTARGALDALRSGDLAA